VVSLNGALSVTGQFAGQVSVDGGELIVNGQTLSATDIQTSAGGLLTMTNAADLVTVDRALFDGGDETGRLTAGTLSTRVLLQTVGLSGHTTSFFASGSHLTRITGSTPGAISFQTPASSRFQDLLVDGAVGSINLSSSVTAAGQLISLQSSGNGPTINTSAPGSVLTAGGADIAATGSFTAITMDGVPLVLSGGAISGFSDVTFQNQNPAGTHLTVNNVGQPVAFIFGNLNFTTPLTGGLYLQANDLDGGTIPLTIDVVSSNPASGVGVSQANNGAVIHWPATGGTITWSSSAPSTDWFNPANWVGGVVPTSLDNVIIGPNANPPALTANAAVASLTIQSTASLDLGPFSLVVVGDMNNLGTVTATPGVGGLSLAGTGASTLRGSFNTLVVVTGTYSLIGRTTAQHLMVIGASGDLNLSGQTLAVDSVFSTGGASTLTMVNATDSLLAQDIVFDGAATTGILTAGTIVVTGTSGGGGNFVQNATNSPSSFAPSGTHKVVFASPSPQLVNFSSPGAGGTGSHFQVLDLTGAVGGLSLTVNTIADSVIASSVSAKLIGGGASLTMRRAQISGLVVDDAPLILDEQGTFATENLSNISFQNFPTTGTTMLKISGPGGTVAARPAVTTTNVDFQSLPTGAGNFYVDLTSTNGGFFTLTMTGSNQSPQALPPGNGPALTKTTGANATVNWP
jgi:hypothetical protein